MKDNRIAVDLENRLKGLELYRFERSLLELRLDLSNKVPIINCCPFPRDMGCQREFEILGIHFRDYGIQDMVEAILPNGFCLTRDKITDKIRLYKDGGLIAEGSCGVLLTGNEDYAFRKGLKIVIDKLGLEGIYIPSSELPRRNLDVMKINWRFLSPTMLEICNDFFHEVWYYDFKSEELKKGNTIIGKVKIEQIKIPRPKIRLI